MKRSYVLPGIVVALGLTILSGLLQGRMRNRWGPSPDTQRAAGKLAQVPAQFGDWKLSVTGKLDGTAERMLECAAYIFREYRNQTNNDVVVVTLLLGPPGPISVHTPEICLPSRDFTAIGTRKETIVRSGDGQSDQFWAHAYKANNLRGDMRREYYAWSTGRNWSASGDPRFKYAGQPYLYKIEISSPLPPGADLQADDAGKKFLQDFLPAVRKCMIEPAQGN